MLNSPVEEHCCGTKFSLYLLGSFVLVIFAGLMAGLTLGLMSLDLVELEVLIKSGRPQDRIHAAKIFKVVKSQHLLLCTLLIGNSVATEALPVLLKRIVPPWMALVVSVTLILMFAEILPQAVFKSYGLRVGATMAPVVRLLVFIFYPISYPLSKVLDCVLGHKNGIILRRAELKTFLHLHGSTAGRGGDLTQDEATIISGVLKMGQKTAKEAMTPISNVFSLDLDTTLNLETLNLIMATGHSRIPVYAGNPKDIIGLILVKDLLRGNPRDAVPLKDMIVRKIPRVYERMPLYDILNEFQKGHSHVAVVYKYLDAGNETDKQIEGKKFEFENNCEKAGQSKASMDKALAENGKSQVVEKNASATCENRKPGRGCSHCILDMDSASALKFPSSKEIVGLITMEDVIEELLQDEILDETDGYIVVQNRITVKIQVPQEKASGDSPTPTCSPATPATPAPGSPTTTDTNSDEHSTSDSC